MSPYLQIFKRFWWLGIPALLGAVAAATVVLYQVDVAFPPTERPTFEKRAKPSYVASTQLFVNNRANPVLRISQTTITPAPKTTGDKKSQPAVVSTQPTNLSTLVQAANVLPLFIESDEVAKLREKLFGRLPGAVNAEALFSAQTPRGLRTSPVPAIEVSALAAQPGQAFKLAQSTVDAFLRWLEAEQERAKVPLKERIVIQQLRAPEIGETGGSNSYGLALLAFSAVFGLFAALAVLLNRLFPAGGAAGAPVLAAAPAPAPALAQANEAIASIARDEHAIKARNGSRTVEDETEIAELVQGVQELLLDLFGKPEEIEPPQERRGTASEPTP